MRWDRREYDDAHGFPCYTHPHASALDSKHTDDASDYCSTDHVGSVGCANYAQPDVHPNSSYCVAHDLGANHLFTKHKPYLNPDHSPYDKPAASSQSGSNPYPLPNPFPHPCHIVWPKLVLLAVFPSRSRCTDCRPLVETETGSSESATRVNSLMQTTHDSSKMATTTPTETPIKARKPVRWFTDCSGATSFCVAFTAFVGLVLNMAIVFTVYEHYSALTIPSYFQNPVTPIGMGLGITACAFLNEDIVYLNFFGFAFTLMGIATTEISRRKMTDVGKDAWIAGNVTGAIEITSLGTINPFDKTAYVYTFYLGFEYVMMILGGIIAGLQFVLFVMYVLGMSQKFSSYRFGNSKQPKPISCTARFGIYKNELHNERTPFQRTIAVSITFFAIAYGLVVFTELCRNFQMAMLQVSSLTGWYATTPTQDFGLAFATMARLWIIEPWSQRLWMEWIATFYVLLAYATFMAASYYTIYDSGGCFGQEQCYVGRFASKQPFYVPPTNYASEADISFQFFYPIQSWVGNTLFMNGIVTAKLVFSSFFSISFVIETISHNRTWTAMRLSAWWTTTN